MEKPDQQELVSRSVTDQPVAGSGVMHVTRCLIDKQRIHSQAGVAKRFETHTIKGSLQQTTTGYALDADAEQEGILHSTRAALNLGARKRALGLFENPHGSVASPNPWASSIRLWLASKETLMMYVS